MKKHIDMIPKNIIRQLMILSIMLVGVFASCSRETVADTPLSPDKGDAAVTFALNVPGGSLPATRGLSEHDETNVETIDVLLFNKDITGKRVYYRKVRGVSVDNSPGNTKSFKAIIPIAKSNDYDITVIANGREQVMAADLVEGEPKAAALNKLVKTIPAAEKWNSNKIPMWGEALDVIVNAGTNLTGENAVRMTRMISRIDVKLSQFAANGTNEAVSEDKKNANFKLESVRLYNYSTKGTLVPDLENGWKTGDDPNLPEATAPNQPAGGYGKALYGEGNEPLVYLAADQHASASHIPDSLIRAIYTLEAPVGSAATLTTNTCLVVGGSYQGGGETYYRIDFVAKDQESQQYEYLHLLRNFRYIVNITKISGEGFGTPEDAFNSLPVNIEAEILEWNEAYLSNVVFDGQNYLSVTPGLFEFYRDAREEGKDYGDNILYVKTDYTSEVAGTKSGWYVEKIVDADDRDLTVDWLMLSPQNGGPKQKNEPADEVKLVFGENKEPETRTAIVIIAAGRLRYEVEVKQSTVPDIMLNIVDPVTKLPVKELVFSSPVDEDPEPQEFRVDWRPEDAGLNIMNTAVIANPFPSGVGAPETGMITEGSGGMITYSMRPQGFSAAQVSEDGGDPFLEMSSKVDFTVSNGASYESKSIFLRQVHYNLLVDFDESYLIDGSTYSLNVRSNAAWRIKSVIETPYGNTKSTSPAFDRNKPILALKDSDRLREGAIGGYNISGEAVTFTVANDRAFWGHIDVTFESANPSQYFEDKTVRLIFALPKLKLMGIAGTSSHGYNIALENDNVNSAYVMLNSSNNFGITAASTVYSHGFELIAETRSDSDVRVQEWLDKKPDIIVFGFNTDITVNQAAMYVDYVDNGGVLIALFENSDHCIRIVDAMFGITGTTREDGGGSGTNHLISSAVDDVVTNGPFDDLKGKYWGEDASHTDAVSIPKGAIVYSSITNTKGTFATALRHPERGFIFVGDGGFCSVNNVESAGSSVCPFKLDDDSRPRPHINYGDDKIDAYNSSMLANMLTWGMMKTTISDN